MDVITLPIESVTSDPNQPRKRFDKEALANLAASITEHGVLEPILVRRLEAETYQIIAGERRYRATMLAGVATIPCIVRDDLSANQREEVSITENTGRTDLNPMEEARAFLRLRERGLSDESIANTAGVSQSKVWERIYLLRLADNLQEMVEKGQIGSSAAAVIARCEGEDQQIATRALLMQGLSQQGLVEFTNRLVESKATVELFTEEQVKERSDEAKRTRKRLDQTIDQAASALTALLDKKTLTLMPQALSGDSKLILEKLWLLQFEVRRLHDSIKAQLALADALGEQKEAS